MRRLGDLRYRKVYLCVIGRELFVLGGYEIRWIASVMAGALLMTSVG